MIHALHERAVLVSRKYLELEIELIQLLIKIDEAELYHQFRHSSLFVYVVEELKLSESVAYSFIAVARKASQQPPLLEAIEAQHLTVAKASRIVSAITLDNAAELIAYAATHTTAETDRRVRKANPEAQEMTTLRVSKAFLTEIKRIRDFTPGKLTLEDAALLAARTYRLQHDPVEKAKRAQKNKEKRTRNPKDKRPKTDHDDRGKTNPAAGTTQPSATGASVPNELCANRAPDPKAGNRQKVTIQTNKNANKRRPLTAEQKHAVHLRDGGRCTFMRADGHRCPNERYLDVHHIVLVSQGGSNDPDNLQTLCGYHHDLVHQLSFGFEDAVNWI